MSDRRAEIVAACDAIAAATRRLLATRSPVLVAIDGPSGSGKTTIAACVAEAVDGAHVPGDDFYAAHVTDAEWDRCSPARRVDLGIDWRRLRTDALEPLRAGRTARWRRFGFERGVRADGTYAMRDETCSLAPRPAIVLDGAYSSRPELADLVDLSVLVDVPIDVRHARLAAREDAAFLAAWHARWDPAEVHYFRVVRPPSAFDLVVGNVASSR